MKLVSTGTFILLILSCFAIGGGSKWHEPVSEPLPRDVVVEFMTAAEKDDEVSMNRLTTTAPAEYDDAKQLEVALYARRTGKKFDLVRTVVRDSQGVRIELEPPARPNRLVETEMPTFRSVDPLTASAAIRNPQTRHQSL